MTSPNIDDTEQPIGAAPWDLWELALRTQSLGLEALSSNLQNLSQSHPGHQDPFDLTGPWGEWLQHRVSEPAELASAFSRLWERQATLCGNYLQRMVGMVTDPVVEPAPTDRRFRDPAWSEVPWFDFMKQSYLSYAEFVEQCFDGDEPLEEKQMDKLRFFAQQWVDAIAPTNFALTNPEVIREAVNSQGASLINGYKNFLQDWENSKDQFRVSLTDPEAFELGENIATTPGKVVFQNDFIQLIQYQPATDQVYKQPLLVIPPWINKYYIMDLRPQNSILKWWVDQGHTVFVISWVNPDQSYADKSFEHYMTDGVYAAVGAVEQITGEDKINAVGYCIGGTLLAASLAHMAAYGDERVQSATFLTTLIDFSDPGEIRAFIDEQQIQNLEMRMSRDGGLDGTAMASAFSMLRANDLIWAAVVNNYLLGKDLPAFDLLHWNADSTRMPEAMHSFYLRNMYLENLLAQPGGLELAGEALDIGHIEIPTYFLSAAEDHIAPWKATYLGAKLFPGPVRFVLGESGHIAGVINPPTKNKYGHQVNDGALPETPEEWLSATERREGSWWPDWQAWIGAISKQKVPARPVGSKELPALEDAPGTYARQRID